MKRLAFVTMCGALFAALAVQTNSGTTAPSFKMSAALRTALSAESGTDPARLPTGRPIPMLSGGVLASAREAMGQNSTGGSLAGVNLPAGLIPRVGVYGCPNTFRARGRPDNIRANQDCGFRWQSEEWVAVDPADPRNVVVSQNDSKLNGNHTGVEFSLNGGRSFGDSVLPTGRISIPGVPGGEWSFDFFSDPAHAFDADGNLYYTTLGADFAQDAFGGLFVWKANSCLKGSALHSPGSGSCRPFSPPLSATAVPVRTSFGNPALSDDKELIAVDAFPNSSPYAGNVYITWTIFNFSCGSSGTGFCESPIYFSRSSDGGLSWSPATQISGMNRDLCHSGDAFSPTANPHACNFDQGSDPVVGPDGSINVVFNNCNLPPLPSTLLCQQLFVKSTDGGETWTRPVKVGDDFDTEPYSVPGNHLGHGCPLFRQCLPPNGYRLDDFPSMGVDASTGKLAVYWSDFRNGGPCATDPTFGLPVEPCANHNSDVFASVSSDGGATWGPTRQVTPKGAQAQWQNWGDVGENGKLYVAYYDRSKDACERTGCNDITLATSTDDGLSWRHQPITTGSMPNLTPGNNPFQSGFLGDYMAIQVFGPNVYLAWGDTRPRDRRGIPEEDVYYATVPG